MFPKNLLPILEFEDIQAKFSESILRAINLTCLIYLKVEFKIESEK